MGAPLDNPQDHTNSKSPGVSPKEEAVIPKPEKGSELTWAERVETAKQAREAGKRARLGKSPVFRIK